MPNIVFIVNLPETKKVDRNKPYQFSIDSWKRWCDETGRAKLVVLDERIYPEDYMNANWHKLFVFQLLEESGISYDQILIADADTIIHPQSPNPFELTDNKFSVVPSYGSFDWVLRGIENYSKHIFDNYMMPWDKYFDCGFMLVNKIHKSFFKKILDFYYKNDVNLRQLQETFHNGTDQTPVNFLIHLENIDLKLFPYEFNMNDMVRKNIVTDDLLFTKVGWIYQYNAIPNNTDNQLTNHFMKKTYEHFYGELSEVK